MRQNHLNSNTISIPTEKKDSKIKKGQKGFIFYLLNISAEKI
jgi:hypothetical protein